MQRFTFALAVVIATVLAFSPSALAQGALTGTLSGAVKDQQGLVLPGVTVTASSPSLQGVRTTVTDANGQYTMPGLPPGTYTVEFALDGMATVRQTSVVPLGGVAGVDVTMGLGGLTEVVRVTAQTPSILAAPTGSFNLSSRELNNLPTGRTPARIAELAPGLTDNTPNVGQVTISGAAAYDNVFLIDGVDVNDNLFGTAHNVFIEDAVDEVTVLTSGISAEYGRFSGGVINLVTKRGGNTFSGSVRLNLTNPSWSDETPFEKSRGTQRADILSKFFEGTVGGPIARDRLWFFAATRRERSESQWALAQVGTPMVNRIENDRYEIKLTGTAAPGHTLQGSFVENKTNDIDRATVNRDLSIDTNVLVTRQTPNRLFVTNYNGVVGGRTFLTAQYSEKIFGFRNTGGTSTAIADSPFRTRGILSGVPASLHYNAPFFSSLDPEDRNNRQFAGSVGYFLTTPNLGSHTFKVGGENFTSSRVGGNSQSATNFVFLSDYRVDGTRPALDAQGRIIPLFIPGTSQVQNWLPTVGASMDLTTLSIYGQDTWAVNDRLTVDVGIRYEKANSEASGDIVGADTSSFVPRLGLSYDLTGDGRTVLQTTYAHYSGKYSDVQFARNTAVGSPSRVTYAYTGPAGEGFDFAPGINLANYATIVSGSFPTANIFLDEGLSPPLTKEFTVSGGREFRRGHVRAIYTWRNASNFIDDFIDDPTASGKIPVIYQGVNFGTFDRSVYRNTDGVERRYQGLQFIGRQNILDNLYVNGHYTIQLENHGNFEGEAANQPANPSDFGDWPEMLAANRNFPDGRLNDFQRHKVRLWAVYNYDMGRAGNVNVAPLWKYNSAQTYSLASNSVALSSVQLARNPGYARLPGGGFNPTLFYDERGTEEFAGYGVMDLSVNYDIPVWRSARPWIKFEWFNVFNNDKLIAWNTTVTPDPNSPVDENGLRTGYIRPANFGTARNNGDYPRPLPGIDGGRTFQMAFGLRF
jgi:outer membrane receptor protein involved in Fe transport